MLRDISEPDWKVFRQLHAIALERFCERALAEIADVISSGKQSSHERYLAVFKLIQRRDKEIANAFNDPRRSAALEQLVCVQGHGLLTDEEMSRFSDETREFVQGLLDIRRR